ncbi:transglutaminase domain-containing protein [Flavobacteriaceae bacterium 3-367]
MFIVKRIVLILLFLLTNTIYSQDYQRVDTIVSKYPKRFSSTAKLAKLISNDFKTESDKVRAVFFWIADNVKYDPKEDGKFAYEYSDKAEYLEKERKYNNKLSERVISKGVAVCEGYSVLFREVCQDLGIKSKVAQGASKTIVKDIGKRFYIDHAWNIVEIDGNSYLVDVTWGAGTYGPDFQKELDNAFYLTPPEVFINRHYPENYDDALLEDRISKERFSNAPLIYETDFSLIAPLEGVIRKSQKRVQFSFACKSGKYTVGYDIDLQQNSLGDIKCTDDKLEFEIELKNIKHASELTLYIDYKAVVTFRLK